MEPETGTVNVKVSGISFGYNGKTTLDGIDLECARGEFIGLIGPNGSGKTTLLRCINGVLKPKVGTIFVEGKNIDRMKIKEIARICANVPTDAAEDLTLTVHEFVFLGRYPYVSGMWWESKDDEAIVDKAIATFKLESLVNRKLTELSSGEQARVLLAKAVVQHPQVMLVDEPSAHLDLRYKLEVMEELRSLSRSGITVITASHDLNLMSKFCDRVMMISQGKIVAFGLPADVMTEENIRNVYGVEVRIFCEEDEIYAIPKRSIRQ
jgi:iron complex transport system ATP-binding protein